MSLTKGDLRAIKSMMDKLDESLSISTAQGFEEVHKKINGVEVRLTRGIKNLTIRQVETLEFIQQHETRITKLEIATSSK